MPKTGVHLSSNAVKIIREYLDEAHLSQEVFADYLQVTPRTLTNWLTGKHAVETDKLQLMIHQLGIGIEDFLGNNVLGECNSSTEVIKILQQLMHSGAIFAMGKFYIKLAKLFTQQLSVLKFPNKGFFQTLEHDPNKGSDYYFEFWIISDKPVEKVQFTLSFTLTPPLDKLYTLRVSYGEVLVQADKIEIKQYFQPDSYRTIERPLEKNCLAKVALWFDKSPHLFVINAPVKFKILPKGRITEAALNKSSDIAVFRKHFFFHSED